MPRRKVLLIQASQYTREGRLCRQRRLHLPGLLFPHLAALTPPDWDVETAIEIIEDVPFDTGADLVAIAAMGHSVFRALEIAREFRRRGKTVVIGGFMASLAPWVVEGEVDAIVFGDAERSWPRLLTDFAAGRLAREYRLEVPDLDGLPVPRYEILTGKRIGFMLPVQAGRGCPHRCSFCSIAGLYQGAYKRRRVDEVVRDIRRIRELGYRGFYLVDDNLIGDRAYLEELLAAVAPLRMRWASQCSLELARQPDLLRRVAASGCRILSFGLESLSQPGLDRLRKHWVRAADHEELLARVNRAGIMASAEFMLGLDGDTPDSLRELEEFVMRTRIAIPRFYILTPIPGTELFREFREEGRLLHENYELYTSTHCVYRPAGLTPAELEAAYGRITRRVYSLPGIVRRVVLNRNAVRHPLLHLYALKVNLDYRRLVRRGEVPNVH